MTPTAKTTTYSSRYRITAMAGIAIALFASSFLLIYVKSGECSSRGTFIGVGLLLSSLGILAVALGLGIVEHTVYRPVNQLKTYIRQLSLGKLETANLQISDHEMGELANVMTKLSEGSRRTAAFAKEMGNGNFTSEYTPLSEHDVLGNALIEMRKNMLAMAEDEKKRNWSNEGMAKFGELLRADTHDIHKFSENILASLIKYTEANQGAFYVLHDEAKGEEYLTLTACYAWGRKKFIDSQIKVGEGLIGQAVLERGTIFMTDVPQGYVHISSGLGHATPHCVIILPLMYNEEVFGVVEMATFKTFEPYQVEFLNKICVGIASSIATVKVNERTNKLLSDSILQGKELQEKDSIMRQQLEEVRATQEEMERKDLQKKQMEWKTNAILEGCVECIIAFDQEGTIEFFNKAAQDIWHISREDAIGMNVSNLLPIELNKLESKCMATIGNNSDKKELTGKTELTIKDLQGEELSILCSISTTRIGDQCFFTAFIQNITVDIF